MKTRYLCLFVLTAVLCGAFFCADSQARVCFATDPDCGSGGNFGDMDNLKKNDCACIALGYSCPNTSLASCVKLSSNFKINDRIDWIINYPVLSTQSLSNSQNVTKIGITTGLCTTESIRYKCPYNSACTKCCDKSFHYEGCIYPLEIAGKCGDRYKCQCPEEYGVSSEYAETNNCQPGGGYCMLNDGTTDSIKYKTCTCDEDIYTDVGSCKNNQTETSSCKDDAGNVRKKCHCDRGVYPYAECMYGPSVGAKTCVDSNSGREYYSRCKTAEEACRTYDEEEDGDSLGTTVTSKKHTGFQHTSCTGVYNCRTKNKVYNPDTKTTEYLTSTNCILGEQCPYPVNPGLYKCVFDKASWCVSHGYTSTMSTKPTSGARCTTADGFVGTYSVCPGNDNNSLFYYNCTLPCEQEVRRALSKGYLTQDDQMVGDDGSVVGFVRTDGSNRHLYFIGNITLPKTYTSNTSWSNIGKKVDYTSINGMYALADANMKYPDGSPMFAGCEKERLENIWKRPEMKIDGMKVGGTTNLLNKPINDLGINIYSSDDNNDEGYGERYAVYNNTWKNVNIISMTPPRNAKISTDAHYSFLSSRRNEIVIKGSNTLTLTGTIGLRIGAGCYSSTSTGAYSATDFYTGQCAYISYAHIRLEGSAVVKFDNAIIDSYSYSSASWDGDNGSVLFYNSKMADSWSSAGNFWSNINVGLSNSDIRVNMIRTNGFGASNTSRRFGGYSDISGWTVNADEKLSRCRGIFIDDYSNLEMIEAGWMDNYTKIYVGWGATLKAKKPIMLNHQYQSLVCLDYGKITVNNQSFGGYSKVTLNGNSGHYKWLGSDTVRSQTNADSQGIWYYKYDKGNSNGQYPCGTGGKCDGKCNSDFDANCVGSNCTYLCTGCYNCTYYGMGY